MTTDQIRAGADARSITPDLATETVYLAGFDFDRPARGIHDELMVRTIAVGHDGSEPIVISVCDLIGMARVHEPKGQRVVACTHTHHGPDMLGFWGKPLEGIGGIDPNYAERVRAAVSASQAAAIAAMEPALLRVGSIAAPDFVTNFRDPEIVDDELSVLRAIRPDGSVIATLCDYPCHPEVVAADNTDVTADFAGHLCRSVEASVGGVAVFAAGALGGMQSPPTEVRTHDEAERYGIELAALVEDALTSGEDVDDPDVSFARGEIEVLLENPIYEMGMEMGLVPAAERRDGLVITEASLIRIGPMTLACVPGELLPKLGLRLKEAMRRAGARYPVIVGLADDELGYILAPEDFTFPADYLDPGKQYEESFSAGPALGPAVIDTIEQLLAEVGSP